MANLGRPRIGTGVKLQGHNTLRRYSDFYNCFLGAVYKGRTEYRPGSWEEEYTKGLIESDILFYCMNIK